jgi:protein-tyrosine phosphatase
LSIKIVAQKRQNAFSRSLQLSKGLPLKKTRAVGYADGCFPAIGEDRGVGGVFQKILFVCVGNICRSPTAEVLLRHARPDLQVSSAGLQALVDNPIEPTAGVLLFEHGLDGVGHRGRQTTPQLLVDADLILVMERKHLAEISRDAPQVSGKTFLVGKWRGNCEIPDPYRQQRPAFEHVYALLEDCVAGWAPYLR